MSQSQRMHRRRRQRWRLSLFFLVLHLLIFLAVWAFAIYRAINIPWLVTWTEYATISEYQIPILAALAWIPILLIHACLHFYFAGQSEMDMIEREAYREGLRDGSHPAVRETYDESDLTVNDDGELVDWMPESKQKRSQ